MSCRYYTLALAASGMRRHKGDPSLQMYIAVFFDNSNRTELTFVSHCSSEQEKDERKPILC
jgi:hypothetical protein